VEDNKSLICVQLLRVLRGESFVSPSQVRYGERQRPGARSCRHMIDAQVADAPHTVPLAVP
jgi:hypothetical protein